MKTGKHTINISVRAQTRGRGATRILLKEGLGNGKLLLPHFDDVF